eukprot:2384750-Pleurochrysis_carterae.AAC.1
MELGSLSFAPRSMPRSDTSTKPTKPAAGCAAANAVDVTNAVVDAAVQHAAAAALPEAQRALQRPPALALTLDQLRSVRTAAAEAVEQARVHDQPTAVTAGHHLAANLEIVSRACELLEIAQGLRPGFLPTSILIVLRMPRIQFRQTSVDSVESTATRAEREGRPALLRLDQLAPDRRPELRVVRHHLQVADAEEAEPRARERDADPVFDGGEAQLAIGVGAHERQQDEL